MTDTERPDEARRLMRSSGFTTSIRMTDTERIVRISGAGGRTLLHHIDPNDGYGKSYFWHDISAFSKLHHIDPNDGYGKGFKRSRYQVSSSTLHHIDPNDGYGKLQSPLWPAYACSASPHRSEGRILKEHILDAMYETVDASPHRSEGRILKGPERVRYGRQSRLHHIDPNDGYGKRTRRAPRYTLARLHHIDPNDGYGKVIDLAGLVEDAPASPHRSEGRILKAR